MQTLGEDWLQESESDQAPGILLSHLPNILKLRLVCASWNHAVENYYQMDWKRGGELYCIVNRKFCTINPDFGKFTRHFQLTHENTIKNPFLFRKLSIGINFADHTEVGTGMHTFLSMYGWHIWYFQLYIHQRGILSAEDYLKLQVVLALMPNLKVFSVTFPSPTDCKLLGYSRSGYSTKILNTVTRHPILPLCKLEELYVNYAPVPILYSLTNCGKNIRVLKQIGQVFNTDEHADFHEHLQIGLPCMDQLLLKRCSDIVFKRITTHAGVSSLKMLVLEFDFDNVVNWNEVFIAISQNWANSLNELSLSVKCVQTQNCYTLPTLDLQCIQRLCIKLDDCMELGFILPMSKSLEFLEIIYSVCMNSGCKTVEKFNTNVDLKKSFEIHCGPSVLNERTIWQTFIKLKVFQFEYICFHDTRREKWYRAI